MTLHRIGYKQIEEHRYSLSNLQLPSSYRLVLGSKSQFRRKVFDAIHIPYSACSAGIDEKRIRDDDPKKLTMKLAEAKLEVGISTRKAILKKSSFSNAIIITGDQVAVKDGVIREKPVNKAQCYSYLESYSNSDVDLYSSVCIYNTETKKRYVDCDVSTIKVGMRNTINDQFLTIPSEVQDHLIKKGDVMYTCGGITVENPELQKCISCMDEMDRVEEVYCPHM
ncbi:hypothetical protein JH06_0806 [Blastocystis sp. subtype 4]|uniref:hypothetical protein n=1 Tax=Blastocystis sp. subtype 4 TaxID=944170 RepID=UPI0007120710|nr:hypothetical protein JH06_0806 [Blastocystis sp. subtype 4]KNB46479.1 hypothetical protein JH06_0806 [Blastocystis sp. subtype 4]|eukprot:XP_014529909.1 hypothetical protein JH06_0806 [Blastocystis sp. subtype 4]